MSSPARHTAALLLRRHGRPSRLFDVVGILTRIGDLVLEHLDEFVEQHRREGTAAGTDPVDPVFLVEGVGDDAGAQAAGRVQTAARVVDADEFGDKEGQADADGGDEGGLVLLLSQHEDSEDELGGQHELDEDALHERRVAGEGGAHVERGGELCEHEGGGGDAAGDLGG